MAVRIDLLEKCGGLGESSACCHHTGPGGAGGCTQTGISSRWAQPSLPPSRPEGSLDSEMLQRESKTDARRDLRASPASRGGLCQACAPAEAGPAATASRSAGRRCSQEWAATLTKNLCLCDLLQPLGDTGHTFELDTVSERGLFSPYGLRKHPRWLALGADFLGRR